MRSLGRSSINWDTTSLTTSTRLAGSLLMVKSKASMEPETSTARIISMPLASTSDVPCTIWGCARATTRALRARIRRVPSHLPALDLRAPEMALAVCADEYRMATAVPFRPLKKARSGSRTSSHKISGWSK